VADCRKKHTSLKNSALLMREQTEWKELVEHGFATIAGSNKEQIILQSQNFISNHFTSDIALYGDGNAGEKIANILENYLN
jgi:UDP-GlcNAc3NAcA epimerase